MPVESLRLRKQEIMPPKKRSSQLTRVASVFDPRPQTLRSLDPGASEQLRCSLMALNQPCAFLYILVPDFKVIKDDHSYSFNRHLFETASTSSGRSTTDSTECTTRILDDVSLATFKDGLNVSSALRHQIEESTRQQSSSTEWFSARAHRITSSICGQILTQKKKTIPLLKRCLYHKPLFDPLPAVIAWGRQNEAIACRKYEGYMNENGHSGLTTQPCGFIIHQTMGWLGASPDARVLDPSCELMV